MTDEETIETKEKMKKTDISSGLIVGGIVILAIGLVIWVIVKYGLTGYWIPLFVGGWVNYRWYLF